MYKLKTATNRFSSRGYEENFTNLFLLYIANYNLLN